MEKLHLGAKWQFRLGGYAGAFILLIFLSWFVAPVVAILGALMFGVESMGSIILLGFIVYVVLIIVVAEIYARLAYNNWSYEFTSTNLKLERGIIFKRYSNVPYERVQNVDIYRGILARMLGFSSVMIQTAGFSGGGRGGVGAEGYIPAVTPASAEKIRDFLMKKISHKSSKSGM